MCRTAIRVLAFCSLICACAVSLAGRDGVVQRPGTEDEAWFETRLNGRYAGHLRIQAKDVRRGDRTIRYIVETWEVAMPANNAPGDTTNYKFRTEIWGDRDGELIRMKSTEAWGTYEQHVEAEVKDGVLTATKTENGDTQTVRIEIPKGTKVCLAYDIGKLGLKPGGRCEVAVFSPRAMKIETHRIDRVERKKAQVRGQEVDAITLVVSETMDGGERVRWNMVLTPGFEELQASWGEGWEIIRGTKAQAMGEKKE